MATATLKRTKRVQQTALDGPLVLFRMTSDEFCELPESETVKLELLDGEVIVSPRPIRDHQYFLSELLVVLKGWVKRRRLGHILMDMLMKLGGHWTPAPDLVFVSSRHLKRVKEKRIEGPVDLAVEILSPSSVVTDRKTKPEAYARFGVKWYWMVDLDHRTLDEYELSGKVYKPPVTISFDELFKPKLFPGLVIDLASLEWK